MSGAVRRRTQAGAALVEGAIVIPLVFMFFLGMADVGLWVFQTTQASTAARDGARSAILGYRQADVPSSADAIAIRQAIVRRVGQEPFGQPVTVAIRCVGASALVPVTGGCTNADVLRRDRVEVTVSWQRRSMSFLTLPFGTLQTVQGRAVMVLQDRPPGVPRAT